MIEIEKWNGYVMENPLLKYLAFVKTVETGSFTRAAQALSYAQSSISKMVADLEQEWGMTLLERSKSGVCLTSAGAQVLPFLRRLLQEQQALEGQISRMNGVETGVVRIDTFSSVAINWLPNIFSALQTDYPGISYDKMEIRFMGMIVTSKAPGAIGPYSQGYAANGFVFVSGQLPINPETGALVAEDISEMTRQSMRNIAAVLEQARSSLDKIVKTTIFVTDLSVFSAVHAAYAEFFKENLPARACVQVAALPKGASVEIEAIAYLCVVLKASALSAEKHPPICTYSR